MIEQDVHFEKHANIKFLPGFFKENNVLFVGVHKLLAKTILSDLVKRA